MVIRFEGGEDEDRNETDADGQVVEPIDAGEVEYELEDWTEDQRLELDAVLNGLGIAHGWESTTLVVPEAMEDQTEQLVAELSAAHRFAIDVAGDAPVPAGPLLPPTELEWHDAEDDEAWVAVDVEVAWYGRRLLGGVIDAAIAAALTVPWEPVRGSVVLILAITAAYAIVGWAGFGRTPGMLVAGTKIVDGEALLPAWGAATWRWTVCAAAGVAAGVIPAELGWSREQRIAAAIAAVVVVLGPILVNGDRRGLHDTAADTYVVLA